jgi:hypothetical protein
MLLGPILLAFEETSPSTTFGTDPTETLTRIELVLDYSDLRLDAVRTSLTTRLDFAFLDQFALRADVPYARFEPDGADTETGAGDTRLQFGWRAFDRRTFAMFFAGGVVLDTASEDVLGTGSDSVVMMVAAAGALPEIRSRLTETVEHFVSYETHAGGEGVALTKLDIRLMTEWSPRVWTRAGTEFFIDWKNGEDTGMNLNFEVGRASASGFALWAGPSFGLFGQDIDGVVDWEFSIGARWLF